MGVPGSCRRRGTACGVTMADQRETTQAATSGGRFRHSLDDGSTLNKHESSDADIVFVYPDN